MTRALLLLALACGAPEPEPWMSKDYGEWCCVCWESWTGGCTAARRSKIPPVKCEARAARPPLCESEVAAMRDAGIEPDAGGPPEP